MGTTPFRHNEGGWSEYFTDALGEEAYQVGVNVEADVLRLYSLPFRARRE